MKKSKHYRMIEISDYAYDRLYRLAQQFFCLGIDGQPSVEDFVEDIAHGEFTVKNNNTK